MPDTKKYNEEPRFAHVDRNNEKLSNPHWKVRLYLLGSRGAYRPDKRKRITLQFN